MDDSPNLKEIHLGESTIETVDASVFEWLHSLKLSATTNRGFREVPIKWVSAERAISSKDRETQDLDETLIYPILTVERTDIQKDLGNKGMIWSAVPEARDAAGGVIQIARKIQPEKSAKFANWDSLHKTGQVNFPGKSKKVVYETITIPIPVYITVSYSIKIRTNYQQQMNEIVQPFMSRPGGVNYVILIKDNHHYEAFIDQSFEHNNNVSEMGNNERLYETTITLEVLGYLIGDGKNQDKPKIVVRENAVEVKFPREQVIYGDIAEMDTEQGYIGISSLFSNRKKRDI